MSLARRADLGFLELLLGVGILLRAVFGRAGIFRVGAAAELGCFLPLGVFLGLNTAEPFLAAKKAFLRSNVLLLLIFIFLLKREDAMGDLLTAFELVL